MRVNRKFRVRFAGLGMLGVFAVIVVLVIGMMTNAFSPTVTVTLQTDRAGLMMAPGNDVKIHGVVIGRVGDVRLASRGAELTLELQPEYTKLVPANARARISPATAFGNKFIALEAPPEGSRGSVRPGSVLRTEHVGVEINTVLENLDNVLTAAKPSEFNTTLHALATAVKGKGDRLGRLLVQVSDYLAEMNPQLPTLQRDFAKTADVSELYADVSDDLFAVLDNATKTGGTIVEKQQQLGRLLDELKRVGNTGRDFFRKNGTDLLRTLRLLEPTSALGAAYAPGLTCFLQGEDYVRHTLEKVFGTTKAYGPGARVLVGVLPGKDPYRYPDNLPQVNTTGGPQCYGLPLKGVNEPQPQYGVPGAGLDNVDFGIGEGGPR